jgi:ParB family transcriptional regulator, chromosome partitioning protein
MEPQKKGLGRGIASLIPVKQEVASVETIPDEDRSFLMVPTSQIVPNPHQPRKFFDEEKIKELANSIRDKGILHPLIVTRRSDSQYELISGERRLRAAKVAGLSDVPVILRDETGPSEILELAIIENVQREDLDPIEEGAAYHELMEKFNYTQEQVAQKVGKDRATVANILRLQKLSSKARQALQSGQITVGHARALLSVPELEKQIYFIDRIAEEGWSVRELEMRVAAKRVLKPGKRGGELKPLPPKYVSLLDTMRRRLGTQVRIVPAGEKGKIIIEYYSESDLDRLYQSLVRQ